MADEAHDQTVTLQWSDHYSHSFGPIGARGMSESGERVDPELVNPFDDSAREAAVLGTLSDAGIAYKQTNSSTQMKWRQYDGGITNSIVDMFTAIGGIAAIASVLKTGREAWKAWLENRSTRELVVKLKDGTEVRVRDIKELDRALTIIQERTTPRSVPPPPEGTPGEW